LIKTLQTSSYHMTDNFNRSASHILLELMLNLIIGFNEDGTYATERDLVKKLLRLSQIRQNGAIYHHIHGELEDLCDFYEELSGSAPTIS
jgi:hypothetical protein